MGWRYRLNKKDPETRIKENLKEIVTKSGVLPSPKTDLLSEPPAKGIINEDTLGVSVGGGRLLKSVKVSNPTSGQNNDEWWRMRRRLCT